MPALQLPPSPEPVRAADFVLLDELRREHRRPADLEGAPAAAAAAC